MRLPSTAAVPGVTAITTVGSATMATSVVSSCHGMRSSMDSGATMLYAGAVGTMMAIVWSSSR
eukprot:3061850-Prymnesium_polylepis.1